MRNIWDQQTPDSDQPCHKPWQPESGRADAGENIRKWCSSMLGRAENNSAVVPFLWDLCWQSSLFWKKPAWRECWFPPWETRKRERKNLNDEIDWQTSHASIFSISTSNVVRVPYFTFFILFSSMYFFPPSSQWIFLCIFCHLFAEFYTFMSSNSFLHSQLL